METNNAVVVMHNFIEKTRNKNKKNIIIVLNSIPLKMVDKLLLVMKTTRSMLEEAVLLLICDL